MVWYWFAARKNGEDRRERIPADSKAEAVSELEKMGYTDIVITDIVIAERNTSNTRDYCPDTNKCNRGVTPPLMKGE